jgi:hypothetical protein
MKRVEHDYWTLRASRPTEYFVNFSLNRAQNHPDRCYNPPFAFPSGVQILFRLAF